MIIKRMRCIDAMFNDNGMEEDEEGDWVSYADHEAALKAQPATGLAEALREAVRLSREAVKRAEEGDPEMDWDQAFQEIEADLNAALSNAAPSGWRPSKLEEAADAARPIAAHFHSESSHIQQEQMERLHDALAAIDASKKDKP